MSKKHKLSVSQATQLIVQTIILVVVFLVAKELWEIVPKQCLGILSLVVVAMWLLTVGAMWETLLGDKDE